MKIYYYKNNYEICNKLSKADSKLEFAVFYLNKLVTEIGIRPAKVSDFDKSVNVHKPVMPLIELIDDPFPIIECESDIYKNKNKIIISSGLLYFLYMLGPFEEKLNSLHKNGELFYDQFDIMEVDDLVQCVGDMVDFLHDAYTSPETVEIPKLTLSEKSFVYALEFIFGHEMSHYLDLAFDRDIRINDQNMVYKQAMECMTEGHIFFKETAYKTFFRDEFDSGELQYLTEELLADLQGFHYASHVMYNQETGYELYRAISLGFIAMNIIEFYMESAHEDNGFIIPTYLREELLAYNVFKSTDRYDRFEDFTRNEWGIFYVTKMLFNMTMAKFNEKFNAISNEQDRTNTSEEIEFNEREAVLAAEDIYNKMKDSDTDLRAEYIERLEPLYKKYKGSSRIARLYAYCLMLPIKYKKPELAVKNVLRLEAVFEQCDELSNLLFNLPILMTQLGDAYINEENYEAALSWFVRSDYWYATVNRPLDRANNYQVMSMAYLYLKDYDNAYQGYKKCLEIRLRDLNANDPLIAETYNSIGNLFDAVGKTQEAYNYYRLALQIISNEPASANTAITYTNLGLTIRDMGRYAESKEYFNKSLKILTDLDKAEDPQAANTYFGLAGAYFFEKDYANAFECIGKTINIYEKTLGSGHPFILEAEQKRQYLLDNFSQFL